MAGERDRQESIEEQQAAVALLQRSLARLESLSDLPSPRRGSMLGLERMHTAYMPLDTLVVIHRSRAIDNLQVLSAAMVREAEGRIVAYPFALYPLIRASIESAATAMWLIQSSRKGDRVLRALQLSYRSLADARSFSGLLVPRGDRSAEQQAVERYQSTVTRLNELKDSIGSLRQKQLGNPPKYTQILAKVSPPRSRELDSPLVVWKLASAFIHGSDHVMRAFSDIRQVTDFDDGVASFEITPSFRMLGLATTTCVNLIMDTDARYQYLATHDHAHRLVDA